MAANQNSTLKRPHKHTSEVLDNTFYKALYQLANDGIMLLQNERFLDCNHRMLELIGRRREEVIGHTPWDISPAHQPDGQDSISKARDFIKRGLAGERQLFEWLHSRNDGVQITFEISLAKISYKDQGALLCHMRDISKRKLIEAALRKSEEQYRRVVQDQLDFIVRWLPDGTRTFISDSYCDYFQQPKEEIIGTSFYPLIPPDQQEKVKARINALTPDNPVSTGEHLVITPLGEKRWQHWIDRAFFDKNGNMTELQSVGRDIHDKKMAEEAIRISEEKYSKAFRCSPEAIMITNAKDGRIIEVNEGFERNTGYLASEAIGRTTLGLGLWADSRQRRTLVKLLNKKGCVKDLEIKVRIKSGELRDCFTSAELIEINHEQCLVSVTRDHTENKKFTTELEYQATHDALTGLHNRNWLRTHLDQLVSGKDAFALIVMDLDQFKEINDTLGHHTGDQILNQISPKLSPILEYLNGDLARLGGDEFAIVLKNVSSKTDVKLAANEILKALEQPFYCEGMRLDVGASLGISQFPHDGQDTHNLLRCADVAMYLSKEQGFGYCFYEVEKDRHSTRRLALMSELRSAVNDGQLQLHFQPKINLHTMHLIGFEALVRWQHPKHGLIPPAQFVPFAELGESIHPMTYWVMENAIKACCEWHKQGHNISISVNLSTRNLLDQGCSERLESLLERYNLAPEYLEFEITESAVIKDPERVLKNLNRIHQIGVRLAIDDFGTGYSSMSYLKRMPLHALKIDLSFVMHMLENEQDEIIVKSTINLAHTLGLTVVAEGVENSDTLNALRKHGCDVAQGYHIAKPMPGKNLSQWISDSHWKPKTI